MYKIAIILMLFIVTLSGCGKKSHRSSNIPEPNSFPDISVSIPLEILQLSHNQTLPPIQENLKNATIFSIYDGDKITPKATFQLQGKVLMKRCYNDFNTKYYPCDLAIGWGDMANPSFYGKINLSQSRRFWFFRYQYSDLDVRSQQIYHQAANMHIIPADSFIQDQVNKIKPGDIIRLSGLLVNIDDRDGHYWRSSMVRTDTGNGACEIIYTQQLEIIK